MRVAKTKTLISYCTDISAFVFVYRQKSSFLMTWLNFNIMSVECCFLSCGLCKKKNNAPL